MPNEKEYLVIEYLEDREDVYRVSEAKLFDIISEIVNSRDLSEEPRKLAVYKIGECVLDIS